MCCSHNVDFLCLALENISLPPRFFLINTAARPSCWNCWRWYIFFFVLFCNYLPESTQNTQMCTSLTRARGGGGVKLVLAQKICMELSRIRKTVEKTVHQPQPPTTKFHTYHTLTFPKQLTALSTWLYWLIKQSRTKKSTQFQLFWSAAVLFLLFTWGVCAWL